MSQKPICGAKTTSGRPCRMAAGAGTDHPGTGRCKHHGGSLPHYQNASAYLRITAEAGMADKPELRDTVKEILNSPDLFNLRFELAREASRLAERIQAMEINRQYYLHVAVIGNILSAFGEIVRRYVPDPATRSSLQKDLEAAIHYTLKSGTTRSVATSVLAAKIIQEDENATTDRSGRLADQ